MSGSSAPAQGTVGQRVRELLLRRPAIFTLGAVVGFAAGAGLLFYLHHSHRLGGSERRVVAAFSEVAEPQAGRLAEQFRPRLAFDRRELWRPLDVSTLLAEGRHRFCVRGGGCTAIGDAAAFDALTRQGGAQGSATYLDIAGGKVEDYRGPERCASLNDCGRGDRSAIYYHVTQSNERFYVDYWWFLRFNHFGRSHPGLSCRSEAARTSGVCDEHEGDWEGVTVVTPPGDEEQVDYVVYAAHKGTFRYAASELQQPGGTHPTVYVARGSHASYPAPCAEDCRQPAGLAVDGLVDLPESTFDGTVRWARDDDDCPANAPGSCLRSLTAQSWATWPGLWGAGCGDACGTRELANSPHSPGVQARYQTPWCSTQGGAFTCDSRALRCSDWLGPQVVAVACDPAVLSRGLRATEAIEPGGLALVLDGSERSQETTPGVVQVLGAPLRPGDKGITAVADGPATQILVRAEQPGVVVEDRFAALGAAPGQRIAITVEAGPELPVVRADGKRPVERRILTAATSR